MKNEEIEEIMNILSPISKLFRNPVRLKTVITLAKSGNPLSFSEISSYLGEGKRWNRSANLSYHIRALEREKIITNERRLDTTTGKARHSFYALSDRGKELAKKLEEIQSIIEDKGKPIPSQKDLVFITKIAYLNLNLLY